MKHLIKPKVTINSIGSLSWITNKSLIMFALLFLSLSANAFTLTDSGIKGYKDGKIKFYLNDDNCPSGVKGDIDKAIDLWNSIPTSKAKLEYKGSSDVAAADLRTDIVVGGFDEDVVIACSTDFATDSANSVGGGGCTGTCLESVVALGTSISYGSDYLNIGYVLINVNAGVGGNYGGLSSSARQIVMAHEMGHVLGLGHSEKVAALMHYSVAEKTTLNLHQDDIDGMTYLYPRDELSGDLPFGCGTVTDFPPTAENFNLWLLALLMPLFLSITLRRFRSNFTRNAAQ